MIRIGLRSILAQLRSLLLPEWRMMTVLGVLLAAGLLLIFATVLGTAGSVSAQDARKVVVVIDFGGGRVEQYGVYLEEGEESISGQEALVRAVGMENLVLQYAGMGAAVCKIRDVGCDDPADCFCRSDEPPDYTYWSYWYWDEGWQYSQVGAAGRQLHDGDADGWAWTGPGPSQAPDFGRSSAPEPTDSPTPTDTPTATDTPSPTHTPTPTNTPTKTPTPTATLPPTQTPSPTGTSSLTQGDETSTPTPPPTATPSPASEAGGEIDRPEEQGDVDTPTSTPDAVDPTAATSQSAATITFAAGNTPTPGAMGGAEIDAATPSATPRTKKVAKAQPEKPKLTAKAESPRSAEVPVDSRSRLVSLGLLGISVASLGGAIVLGLASALLWRRWPG